MYRKHVRLAALALAAALLSGCGGPDPADPGGSAQSGTSVPPEGSIQVQPAGPNVRADWSRLEGREKAAQPDRDGGRWYASYTGELIPGPDYGELIPFVGAQVYNFNEYEYQGQPQAWYSNWPNPLYGLMTREGRIVVDPVYNSAYGANWYWQGKNHPLPVLILTQAREEWKDLNNGGRVAVAAADGSWVTDFQFWNYTTRESRLFLVGDKGCTLLDSGGGSRRDWSWEELGITADELPRLWEDLMWLYGLDWTDRGVFLGSEDPEDWENTRVRIFHPETGEVSWEPRQQWEEWLHQWYSLRWGQEEKWTLERDGESTTLTRGEETYTLSLPPLTDNVNVQVEDGLLLISIYQPDQAWDHLLYDLSSGRQLLRGADISFLWDEGDPGAAPLIQVQQADGSLAVYNREMKQVLAVPSPGIESWTYCSVRSGVLTAYNDRAFAGYYDLATGDCLLYRNFGQGD